MNSPGIRFLYNSLQIYSNQLCVTCIPRTCDSWVTTRGISEHCCATAIWKASSVNSIKYMRNILNPKNIILYEQREIHTPQQRFCNALICCQPLFIRYEAFEVIEETISSSGYQPPGISENQVFVSLP